MATKVKKKIKAKKPRPKARPESKAKSAGEHLTCSGDPKPIIKLQLPSDKVLKKWRVVINARRSYYKIHYLTLQETLELHDELGTEAQYVSFASFSQARRYLYKRVRFEISILTDLAAEIRLLRKSDHVID